jgi:multidrug efflux pump subunit AcrA (membrane-fusion protein)
LAVAALATIAAILFGVPADVKIKATGELQPVNRHEVFAPRDGVVTAIHVDHASRVQAGEALLEMRSPDLDLEMQRVAGELETARKRLAAVQSERLQTRTTDTDARLRQRRLTADEEQLSQQVRDLSDRQNMLARQKTELNVASPVAGEVITWNVQQQLATRPLRRGDALLTVADVAGPWKLELKIESRRAGRVLAAQAAGSKTNEVSFMLATDPGRTLTGTLETISPRLETDPSGETYLVATVSVPLESLDNPTPGATAFARIDCGRGSLAQAWFHDLFDAARLWMPF